MEFHYRNCEESHCQIFFAFFVSTRTKIAESKVHFTISVESILKYIIIWFYQLSWQCKLATVKRFARRFA